jgi:hypothetical protein
MLLAEGAGMIKDADKYRRKAAEARAKAENSFDTEKKSYWLAIAMEWQRLLDATEAVKRK